MKRFALLVVSALLVVASHAQTKTKVLLLGTFHFDNPGLDVAKFENADVLSPKRQQEIIEVIEQLKVYRPTKIFVEMPPETQAGIDAAVIKYKAGQTTLKANEVFQIGYRLAKELDLPTVYAVDYRDAQFPYDSLVKVAVANRQHDLLGFMKRSIDSIEQSFNASLKTKTIKALLLEQNTDKTREFQVGAYYHFLEAGDRDNHVGAYLVSEWWRRNMVIYGNIQKRLERQDERILVLFGSAHTALLHEMMKYNPGLELVPVNTVLR
jgi:hypothetical protein